MSIKKTLNDVNNIMTLGYLKKRRKYVGWINIINEIIGFLIPALSLFQYSEIYVPVHPWTTLLIYSWRIGANQSPSSWGPTKHRANRGFRKGFMFGPLGMAESSNGGSEELGVVASQPLVLISIHLRGVAWSRVSNWPWTRALLWAHSLLD